MIRFTFTVTALMLALASPASRANELACIAQLCLSGGASCGNAKFPGCGPAIGQYCHLLGLFKGLSKARNFLNQCKYAGSQQVSDFAVNCTGHRLMEQLAFTEYHGDNGPVDRIRLDVPESCKPFVQQTYTATQAALAQLPYEYRGQIPATDLLPVMTVRWHGRVVTEEYGLNPRVVYTPEYKWAYQNEIPRGFTMVYNPNSGDKRACPPRFRGDQPVIYSTTSGC